MGSPDSADVHIQGSAVASSFIKMHKGALKDIENTDFVKNAS